MTKAERAFRTRQTSYLAETLRYEMDRALLDSVATYRDAARKEAMEEAKGYEVVMQRGFTVQSTTYRQWQRDQNAKASALLELFAQHNATPKPEAATELLGG